MEEIETHKEKIYKILKKTKMGLPIAMTPMAQEVGCTLSHLSITFRMAKEVGFLGIHDQGDYVIRKMPDTYKEFKDPLMKKQTYTEKKQEEQESQEEKDLIVPQKK